MKRRTVVRLNGSVLTVVWRPNALADEKAQQLFQAAAEPDLTDADRLLPECMYTLIEAWGYKINGEPCRLDLQTQARLRRLFLWTVLCGLMDDWMRRHEARRHIAGPYASGAS